MINILLPMAGTSSFFDGPEYPFPKPLIDVLGKPMIEHVINNLKTINNTKFVFILREEDCVKFHLDSTVRLLAGEEAQIIRSKGETKGASCTAMLAIKHIQNDSPLIIVNSDQIINEDLNLITKEFYDNNIHAGCITFNSVHPRWSYVRHGMGREIVETAEKRPLSRNAIAGFYYFSSGRDFIEAAQESIRKDAHVDGKFYISSALNEYILNGKTVMSIPVDSSKYITFYSPQKIAEFENIMLAK